jgi:hypothetical protein
MGPGLRRDDGLGVRDTIPLRTVIPSATAEPCIAWTAGTQDPHPQGRALRVTHRATSDTFVIPGLVPGIQGAARSNCSGRRKGCTLTCSGCGKRELMSGSRA